jgi:neuroligin
MKPSISEHTIGNFGLLDQIAALHWVKENIAAFNGDPGSVTLAGHGTGAACVNFLMVSPVAHGILIKYLINW